LERAQTEKLQPHRLVQRSQSAAMAQQRQPALVPQRQHALAPDHLR
jgi:hypothetical protein